MDGGFCDLRMLRVPSGFVLRLWDSRAAVLRLVGPSGCPISGVLQPNKLIKTPSGRLVRGQRRLGSPVGPIVSRDGGTDLDRDDARIRLHEQWVLAFGLEDRCLDC